MTLMLMGVAIVAVYGIRGLLVSCQQGCIHEWVMGVMLFRITGSARCIVRVFIRRKMCQGCELVGVYR